MLKRVNAKELRVGMFIHDLDCGWMDHPFLRNRFMLHSEDEIYQICNAMVRTVIIDCSLGIDIDDAPTLIQADATTQSEIVKIAAKPIIAPRVSLSEELQRAAHVRKHAMELVRKVMADSRLGKAVELDKVGPVVKRIVESILGNPSALLGLLRIRDKDDYTLMHSVSVGALLVAFCHSRNMDEETIYQAGIGGLLHDTGKALVPNTILNKAGRLTDEEFDIIKRHPRDGYDILIKTPEIGPIPLDITLHHHERRDGSGYPDRQGEGRISELAQMAAIVDVYDAITSERCYHKGIPAAEAMRKIYEWSGFHLDPTLAQDFIRCVGIYPVGTLVLLESGRLGVVIEAHETSLLTPKINVFFSVKSHCYINPQTIDLSKPLGFGGADKIVRHESAERWKVTPSRFMNIAT